MLRPGCVRAVASMSLRCTLLAAPSSHLHTRHPPPPHPTPPPPPTTHPTHPNLPPLPPPTPVSALDPRLARYSAYLKREADALKDGSSPAQLDQVQREIRVRRGEGGGGAGRRVASG